MGAVPGIDLGTSSTGPFTDPPSRKNRKTYVVTGPEYDDQPPLPATKWSPCSERLGACVQNGSLASAGDAAASASAAVEMRTARRANIELAARALALLLFLGDRLLFRHRGRRLFDDQAAGL